MRSMSDYVVSGQGADLPQPPVEIISDKLVRRLLAISNVAEAGGVNVEYLNSGLRRAADVTLALLLIVAMAPTLLLIAAAIPLTSRGPVFYVQQRHGRDLRPFSVLSSEPCAGPARMKKSSKRFQRIRG